MSFHKHNFNFFYSNTITNHNPRSLCIYSAFKKLDDIEGMQKFFKEKTQHTYPFGRKMIPSLLVLVELAVPSEKIDKVTSIL